jgi:hypothetical protein
MQHAQELMQKLTVAHALSNARDARFDYCGLMPRLCNGLPSNLDFLSQRAHLPAKQRHARQGRNDLEYKDTDLSDI